MTALPISRLKERITTKRFLDAEKMLQKEMYNVNSVCMRQGLQDDDISNFEEQRLIAVWIPNLYTCQQNCCNELVTSRTCKILLE